MSYANWQPSTTYTTNDIVEYNGYLWISLITPNLNNIPGAGSPAWGSQSPSSGGVLSVTAGTGITVNGTTNVVVSASPISFLVPYDYGSATPQTYATENPTLPGFVGGQGNLNTVSLGQLVFSQPYDTFIITLNCAFTPITYRAANAIGTTSHQIIIFPGQNNGDAPNYNECATPLTFPIFSTSDTATQYPLTPTQATMIYRVATPTQTVDFFPFDYNSVGMNGYLQVPIGSPSVPSILFSAIAYNG